MSDIIALLPDRVANQIAAGEVVQRPASVVKELLENAIDADARRIDLLVKDAGKTLIQVADDGIGMSRTDARLSFSRHATSKIKSAEDLFKLTTKGFRGEALASIAAVAQVQLKTKTQKEEIGTAITIEGSKIISQEPCVTPKGTIITVKNLFFNIPARRNFLKSDAVEMRHIIDEFERVALAHPKVSFALHHNGTELFQLPPSNEKRRIIGIFGKKMKERLVPIGENTDWVKISGFIGKPKFSKRTKGEQFFFVNRRFIKSSYLNHAVLSAYEGLLQDKKYPAYFIFLEVDPHSIDINIHPTKTEIKFDDEHTLYAFLRSTVKHSLGQFDISPTLDFKNDPNLDPPYHFKNRTPQPPKIEVDPDFNPFKEGVKAKFTPPRHSAPKWESLYTGVDPEELNLPSKLEYESEVSTGSLFPKEEQSNQNIFQIERKYIVSPLKSGALIIHQHRAHFRILYEDFLKNITVETALSQQLLFPLEIELSKKEIALLTQLKESLENTGFNFSIISEEKATLTGIPSTLRENQVAGILDKVLADFRKEVQGNKETHAELLARTLAKNTAIPTGTLLNKEEQITLINQLFACKVPKLTPTNKKVFIQLSTEELDKNF